jgi:hypothetical protein
VVPLPEQAVTRTRIAPAARRCTPPCCAPRAGTANDP